jgi:preprotein translocase subunit SecD
MTPRIGLVLTATAFVLAVAACGGGDATSTRSPTPAGGNPSGTETANSSFTGNGRAVVQADLSSAASPQDTIEKLEQVIQDRLGDAGVRSNISQTSDAELTIDFTGARTDAFVKQVIDAQNLNFREPIINSGEVLCQTSDGAEFPVPASVVQVTANHTGTRSASCSSNDGHTGSVEWEPAQADVNGVTKALTQAMIDAAKVEISSTPQRGTVLLLTFTPEGTSLFTALTGRLVSYPLGIFLGDTLLSAPTVQAQITNSSAVISGASDDELAAAKAVLKGGELPVPVSVTSIAPGSPAP